MKRNNLRHTYNKKIDNFEKKFKIKDIELNHLKSKCPRKELDLEFKEENNALLQLKKTKSELCEIGNILTSNMSPYKGQIYVHYHFYMPLFSYSILYNANQNILYIYNSSNLLYH